MRVVELVSGSVIAAVLGIKHDPRWAYIHTFIGSRGHEEPFDYARRAQVMPAMT